MHPDLHTVGSRCLKLGWQPWTFQILRFWSFFDLRFITLHNFSRCWFFACPSLCDARAHVAFETASPDRPQIHKCEETWSLKSVQVSESKCPTLPSLLIRYPPWLSLCLSKVKSPRIWEAWKYMKDNPSQFCPCSAEILKPTALPNSGFSCAKR